MPAWPDTSAITNLKTSNRWNAAELRAQVTRKSNALARAGFGKSSIVVVAHGADENLLADLMAAWACGATAVCLDQALTEREFDNLMSFLQPDVFLCSMGAPTFRPAGITVLDLSSAAESNGDYRESECKFGLPGADEDIALVLFTSGTTGAPKAVTLSYGALAARLSLNVEAIGKDALGRSLVTLPLHFGHGLIGNTLTPLWAGGEVFLPQQGLPLARGLGQFLDAHGITFISSVPSLWHLVLKFGKQPTRGSLKRVHVGSAPLSELLWRSIAKWAKCEVWNCYGTTETANWIGGASSREGFAYGKVGKPWGGELGIKLADGSVAPKGEGPILVRVPSLMSGYLKRPDLTAEVLSDGWYDPGDIGRIDEQGVVWLTGRAKDEINRGGMKVQPAELDALLETHPEVEAACTFAVSDPVGGEMVGAAIQLKPGSKANAAVLRVWCAQRIRSHCVPDQWHFVETIPLTDRGKINRRAVAKSLTGVE